MNSMKWFPILMLVFLMMPLDGFGQNEKHIEKYTISDSIPSVVDSLYREDQFYVGFSYNLLINKPSSISQSGFSGGLHLGIIRDFPLNKKRNFAFGAGLGWSINSYGQNLFIGEDVEGESIFRSLDNKINYSDNDFINHLVEVPLEFRWRTSTATDYKFWRVYAGVRLGYMYYFKSKFKQPQNTVIQTDVPELDRFRLGTTFTFGYNTFNFSFYYSLNPLFKDASIEDESVDMTNLKIGLMFYIL